MTMTVLDAECLTKIASHSLYEQSKQRKQNLLWKYTTAVWRIIILWIVHTYELKWEEVIWKWEVILIFLRDTLWKLPKWKMSYEVTYWKMLKWIEIRTEHSNWWNRINNCVYNDLEIINYHDQFSYSFSPIVIRIVKVSLLQTNWVINIKMSILPFL
jgi:hypothetical protein